MNFDDLMSRDWRDVFLGLFCTFLIYKFVKKFLKLTRKVNYRGKTVVLTGASAGIGEELAIQYAELGANLILAARRIEKLESVVAKCKKLGVEAIAVKTDVSIESDCRELIETAAIKFGGIDLLVLNAGTGCLMRLDELNDDFTPFRDTMQINYWGYVYPTYFALPHLRKTKGTIVAVSSLAAKLSTPRRSAYAASKAAVHGFLDCLRLEEPDIHISIVCPGFVLTEIHDRAFTPDNKKLHREKGRFMTAKEAAKIIIDAAQQRKREVIMTLQARVGILLRPFFPDLIDSIAKKKAEESVKRD